MHADALPLHEITGLILAGGRGTRMGTVDKGLQLFRDRPMVQTIMQRLAPQVGTVLINANQNIDRYAEFGWPVWPDAIPDFAGPLAGLHCGLLHCTSRYLMTVPCDSPFLPDDLSHQLSSALIEANADLAVAVTGSGVNKQPHPVFCFLKATLLPHLAKYLEQGGRKMESWYQTLNFIEVPFADEAAFANINTASDLRKLEK